MLDGSTSGPRAGSPEWWLRRLSRRLDRRLGNVSVSSNGLDVPLARWESYYRGKLNLALASAKWRAEFATRFPQWSANFMATAVNKHRERLQVQGIRYGTDPGSDDDAWGWWQDNHLDAESVKLFRMMLVDGSAYVLVWPNPETGEPEASIESAAEVVVETVPGKSWQRQAALKRWVDDDGYLRAELYLPDRIHYYRSTQRDLEFSSTRWVALARWQTYVPAGAPDSDVENPYGVVPIVPFVHMPDAINEGVSKIAGIATNQDAINKYRVDALVAAEFASFRQRWVIGLDIPTDPETGQPVEAFRSAVDRLWMVPPPDPEDHPDARTAPPVQFGEFDVTPLSPFYDSIAGELRLLAVNAPLPQHYVLPQSGQPPSGDSLRAAEAMLVAAVLDTQVDAGEGVEEVFRLQFLMRDDPKAQQRQREVIWRDPEVQSEGEHIDALLKMRAMGVPDVALWERMRGVTQQTIKRWQMLAQRQGIDGGSLAPPTQLTLLAGGQANAPASARLESAAGAEPAR